VSAADAAGALRSSVRGGVTTDVSLAPFTSFRLGGAAAILVEAFDEPDLLATASVAASSGLPILSLGRGSNVLVSDRGYPGIVVRLGKGFEWIADGEDGLEAGGATPLPRLANRAAGRGLSGLEFAVAIPASLGGAVRMNAGAHNSSLADVLDWVRLYRLGEAAPAVLPAAKLGMRYRSTNLDDNDIVCAARLALTPAPPGEIGEIALRMQRYRDHRAATQPAEARNAGSMFRNPEGASAGRLIEEAGMKGHRAGRAEVSGKHANFFLAPPGATAQDVHRLLVEVQAAVLERTGILLTPEIRLIGRFEQPDLVQQAGGAGEAP
jgi:UDP-N-acetylmuramate dehydrogenase